MSDFLVTPNNSLREISPKNGKKYTLKELQQLVEGDIELRFLGHNKVLVVDEEGKLKGKTFNAIATGWIRQKFCDYIVGTALLISDSHI